MEMRRIIGFCQDESGVVASEYGILISLIALAVVGSISLLGTNVRDTLYMKAAAALQ